MSQPDPSDVPEFLYHGTGEGAFRQIRQHGLKCRNGKVYCANTEQYAETYSLRKGARYGVRILWIVFSGRFFPHTCNAGGDYISYEDISPEDIEVKTQHGWMPIQVFCDNDIGIMPMLTSTKVVEAIVRQDSGVGAVESLGP